MMCKKKEKFTDGKIHNKLSLLLWTNECLEESDTQQHTQK